MHGDKRTELIDCKNTSRNGISFLLYARHWSCFAAAASTCYSCFQFQDDPLEILQLSRDSRILLAHCCLSSLIMPMLFFNSCPRMRQLDCTPPKLITTWCVHLATQTPFLTRSPLLCHPTLTLIQNQHITQHRPINANFLWDHLLGRSPSVSKVHRMMCSVCTTPSLGMKARDQVCRES